MNSKELALLSTIRDYPVRYYGISHAPHLEALVEHGSLTRLSSAGWQVLARHESTKVLVETSHLLSLASLAREQQQHYLADCLQALAVQQDIARISET